MHTIERGLIRLPILPFSTLARIENTVCNDRLLEKSLMDLLLKSVFFSSPQFYQILKQHLDENKGVICDDKIKLTVLKYFNRISQRATPFGTMAYVSSIQLCDESLAINPSQEPLNKNARLDSEIANEIINFIKSTSEVSDSIRLFSNNSVYVVGDKIRYIESIVEKGQRKFKLSSVEADDIVLGIIDFCRTGKRKGQIIEYISSLEPLYEYDDIKDYLDDFVQNGLLINALELSIADTDFLEKATSLIQDDDNSSRSPSVTLWLNKLKKEIQKVEKASFPALIKPYNKIENLLNQQGIQLKANNPLLQIDSTKNIDVRVNKKVADKTLDIISLLGAVNMKSKHDDFESFKESFIAKYDNRPVPLLHALDPDIGIGYPVKKNIVDESGDELLSMLENNPSFPNAPLQYIVRNWHRFVLRKYQQAKQDEKNEIHLTTAELKSLALDKHAPMPPTLTALCKLYANSPEEIDRGTYLIQILDIFAPSGANVYARFSPLHTDIHELAQEIIGIEERYYDGVICVEVEHIGQIKTANVNIKNFSRSWKLRITDPPTSNDHTKYLALTDIYVQIGNGNQLILFSKKHGRQIIPRITSSYNYHIDDLPIVSFLGDIQHQIFQNNFFWDWGILKEFDNLPRVTIDNNIIVSPATWTIRKQNLLLHSFSSFRDSIQRSRHQNIIPQRVLYGKNDNLLLLDLENDLYLKMLYKEIRNQESLTFSENLNTDENNWISTENDSYSNEILFSYYSDLGSLPRHQANGSFQAESDEMSYCVLENWIFLKIYHNSINAENLILNAIHNIVDKVQKKTSFKRWFFVKYFDQAPHIRLRLKLSSSKDVIDTIEVINNAFRDLSITGFIDRILYDRYAPEITRYGKDNIQYVETIFCVDSEAILRLRILLSSTFNNNINWLVGLYNMQSYLSMFFYDDLPKKLQFVKQISTNLKQEYELKGYAFKRINTFYQSNKEMATAFLKREANEYTEIYNVMAERDKAVKEILTNVNMNDTIRFSLIHMSLNRLFPINPRKKEMICYDLLNKILNQEKHIKKSKIL